MSRAFAVASGALLLLAACATDAPEDVEPATPPPLAAPAAPARPPAASPAPAPAPRDACGAAELQSLIGHSRSEIPVPLHPDRQRVACTTCPITQDYNPGRLNFFFDAQTGRIKEIRCG